MSMGCFSRLGGCVVIASPGAEAVGFQSFRMRVSYSMGDRLLQGIECFHTLGAPKPWLSGSAARMRPNSSIVFASGILDLRGYLTAFRNGLITARMERIAGGAGSTGWTSGPGTSLLRRMCSRFSSTRGSPPGIAGNGWDRNRTMTSKPSSVSITDESIQ